MQARKCGRATQSCRKNTAVLLILSLCKLAITAIFCLFFTILSNLFSLSNLLSLSFIFWGCLYLISIIPIDFYDSGVIIRSYSIWLMIISVLVLYFIYIFSSDNITIFLFNMLGLNILIFFFRRRVIVFYIAFEFALIPMVILILLRGYQPERIGATLWFILYTIIGSLPLLFIFVSYNFTECRSFIIFRSSIQNYFLIFPLVLAFMIKLPVFGFHLWLPKAHVQAPVSGRIFLAAVLLKIGGYGLFFIKPLVLVGNWVPITVIIISVLGSVLAITFCMILDDLKQVIAYSRIGHMGLVVSTILSDNEIGILRSLLIMVGHGFTSSLIFYLGNEAYLVRGSRSLRLTKGIISVSPLLSLVLGIVLILNISFPPSINVFGEMRAIIAISGIFPSNILLVLGLVLLGGIFNIKLFLRISHGINSTISPILRLKQCPIIVRVRHILPYLLLPIIISSV